MYGIRVNDFAESTELALVQADLDQEVKAKTGVEAEAEVVAIKADLVNAVIRVIEE